MSRIGKSPISIPQGVTVSLKDETVTVQGAKGVLSFKVPQEITVSLNDSIVTVESIGDYPKNRAFHGLVRAKIANLIHGVSLGWSKTLTLTGVGYRATLSGANVVLTVGFSHPVTIVPPEGISFTITEGKIMVSGIDKDLVGQVASNIRGVKPPEPYKGKGIAYEKEYIRKKAGKSAKGVGGASGGAK